MAGTRTGTRKRPRASASNIELAPLPISNQTGLLEALERLLARTPGPAAGSRRIVVEAAKSSGYNVTGRGLEPAPCLLFTWWRRADSNRRPPRCEFGWDSSSQFEHH